MMAQAAIPPPDLPQQICPAPSEPNLFEFFERRAAGDPALVFACAHLLQGEQRRDRLLRQAFASAVSGQRDVAGRYIAQVIDRPWLGEVSFFDALAVAKLIRDDTPRLAARLLVEAASKNPSVAVREVAGYVGLPGGREAFEDAALAVPGETVLLAAGRSPTAAAVLDGLKASGRREIELLARLSEDPSMDRPTRQKVAVFNSQISSGKMRLKDAIAIAGSGPRYFSTLAGLRIASSGTQARLYERVLENYAQTLFRGFQENGGASADLKHLSARDLYLLLTYGRTEEDDKLFGTIFDELLLPKMRAEARAGRAGGRSPNPVARLLDGTRDLNLRTFLSASIAHRRLEAFLSLAGNEPERAALLARSMKGIETSEGPLEQAVAAAEIIDATNSPARLRKLKEAVYSDFSRLQSERTGKAGALYGLLAARLLDKLPQTESAEDESFRRVGVRFRSYFKEVRSLDVASLFGGDRRSIQRWFFYNDDDGVESFETFRESYRGDPAWTWQEQGAYVRVTGKGRDGRIIEIFANVPADLLSLDNAGSSEEIEGRQQVLTRVLSERGLDPSVVVHRGHSYHVEKTLRYLTRSAKLVFLGSCRGLASIDSVMEGARDAQLIATRGVGSHTINDPMLKALNDDLLDSSATLDWSGFWKRQQARLEQNPLFEEYMAPHENSAAILLGAYYDYLANGAGH